MFGISSHCSRTKGGASMLRANNSGESVHGSFPMMSRPSPRFAGRLKSPKPPPALTQHFDGTNPPTPRHATPAMFRARNEPNAFPLLPFFSGTGTPRFPLIPHPKRALAPLPHPPTITPPLGVEKIHM